MSFFSLFIGIHAGLILPEMPYVFILTVLASCNTSPRLGRCRAAARAEGGGGGVRRGGGGAQERERGL
jgi:hypothetical protein